VLTLAGNWALNSSAPEGLNSEMYGSAPQPTNRLPSGMVWALPSTSATRPSGWLSDLRRVATSWVPQMGLVSETRSTDPTWGNVSAHGEAACM
jgi:hypothetical protein